MTNSRAALPTDLDTPSSDDERSTRGANPASWLPSTLVTPVSLDLSRWGRLLPGVVNLSVSPQVSARKAISLVGDARANVLTGHGGTDTLTGGAGNDTLLGLAGQDVLNGDDGDDRLDGGAGSDALRGGAGQDTLLAGDGSDTLTGGAGNDRFVVQAGQGLSTLTDLGTLAGDADTLLIDAGVRDLADLWAQRDASSTTLTVRSTGQRIALQGSGWGSQDTTTPGATVQVMLNGQAQTLALTDLQRLAQVGAALPGINPSAPSTTWDELQQLYWADSQARIWQQHAAPLNPVFGTAGDDDLQGTTGGDMLLGGAGRDTLTGGAGDDVLVGGAGADTYVIQSTMSQVTVIEAPSAADAGGNVLRFSDDHDTLAELMWFSRPSGSRDLVINDLANAQTITVRNAFGDTGINFDELSFGIAGQRLTLNARQIDLLVKACTSLNPDVDGVLRLPNLLRLRYARLLMVMGLEGYGATAEPDLMITGTSLSETLYGATGNDTVVASGGNDTLQGGLGNDTYRIALQAPGQTITLSDAGLPGESNTLALALEDRPDQLWMYRGGSNNLVITNLATRNTVLVSNWFTDITQPMAITVDVALLDGSIRTLRLSPADVARIVQIQAQAGLTGEGLSALSDATRAQLLADLGAAWGGIDLSTLTNIQPTAYNAQAGTAGGDTLSGSSGNDFLQGLGGNDTLLLGNGGIDTLLGGAGADTYLIDEATGMVNALIDDNDGANTLLIADGSSVGDLWWRRTSTNDLQLHDARQGSTVTLRGWFLNIPAAPAVLVRNGQGDTTLSPTQLLQLVDLSANFNGITRLAEVPEADRSAVLARMQAIWYPDTTPVEPPNEVVYQRIEGSEDADYLTGSEGSDLFLGLGGPDNIDSSEGGDDMLIGGAGDDQIADFGGDDIYVFDAYSGQDRVIDMAMGDERLGRDTFRFEGLSIDQLWFSTVRARPGAPSSTLVISALDTGTSVQMVQQLTIGNANDVFEVTTAQGTATLDMASLYNLITVMATFSKPAAGQPMPDDVLRAIQANWATPTV